jgi:uncharacterized protein (DUF305 family)
MRFSQISSFLVSLVMSISALSMMPTDITPVDAALEQAMASMHSEMAEVQYTANPDLDFAAMMIPHHVGAVKMAKVELQYGTDSRLRRLAQEIIVTQNSEIELMRLALKRPMSEVFSVTK